MDTSVLIGQILLSQVLAWVNLYNLYELMMMIWFDL